jgi:glycosyltransferase involved in cell wall biosynthesis
VGRAPASDESLQLLLQCAGNLITAHAHHLVHGFYAVSAGYVATVAASLAGRKSAVSLRGNDLDRAMFHGPRLPLLLWTLANAGALIGVSAEILAKARALSGRAHGLHQVGNAVDAAFFTPGETPPEALGDAADAPRPWIAFSGEARLKKGLPLLLELAERLAVLERGTLFWIGGVREEERDGVRLWRRRAPPAAARVREIAYVADRARLRDLYRAMDLFVFPSLWEGLPNALLETMACGKPVLATAVGASPEVVRHGDSGFLLGSDRLDGFAAEALRVLELPAEALRLVGEAARARVARDFKPEAERDGILRVWEGLLA